MKTSNHWTAAAVAVALAAVVLSLVALCEVRWARAELDYLRANCVDETGGWR